MIVNEMETDAVFWWATIFCKEAYFGVPFFTSDFGTRKSLPGVPFFSSDFCFSRLKSKSKNPLGLEVT